MTRPAKGSPEEIHWLRGFEAATVQARIDYGWRVIDESTPKEKWVRVWLGEGSAVLVLTDCYGRTIQHPDNPRGETERKARGIEHCYEWRDGSGDGAQDYRPTHWMEDKGPTTRIHEEWPTHTSTEARAKFADIFDAACFGNPCFITKHGRRVVAIIPIEMFRALEKYEDELERTSRDVLE